jgi:formate dehydrogenase subunit gamma
VSKIIAALGALAAAAIFSAAGPVLAQDAAQDQAKRQQVQPLNNAPIWREVRSGDPAYTSIKGRETDILIQPSGQLLPGQKQITAGENWRLARVPLATIGGALIAFTLLVLLAYYTWKGSIGVHEQASGRYIQRFSGAERAAHWTMGISFVVLAITGLILTFGKNLLLPLLGYTLFAWLATGAKNLHNFVGPIFSVALPVFIVLFLRDNLPKAHDVEWLKKAGGMLSGEHVPSGRFNAGEKGQFWVLVVLLGMVLIVTGLILNFPNFGQSRSTMQLTNVIHLIAAVLATTLAAGHVYLGTVGMKGAFEAMRYGYVDETWAKEHHQYWYEDVKAGKSRQRFVDAVPAETAARVREAIGQHG